MKKTKAELKKEKDKLISEMETINRSENPAQSELLTRSTRVAEINGILSVMADDEPEKPQQRSEQGPLIIKEEEETKEEKKEAEYRSSFDGYLRKTEGAEAKVRSLSTEIPEDGGYLVPTIEVPKIKEKKESKLIMRRLATVITSSHDRNIPLEGDVSEAKYIPEGGKYPEGSAKFGSKGFKAFKKGIIVKAPDELVHDSKFNLFAYLKKKFLKSIDKLEERAFLLGTGTNEPEGVLVGARVGVASAASTAITAKEIIDFIFCLDENYSTDARIIMKKTTMAIVRDLWEADKQKFRLDQIGKKYFIEGVEVEYCKAMPAFAPDNIIMAYGDFSEYHIVDRLKMEVKVLKEKYADEGKVGYRFTTRNDGGLMDKEAVKTFKMAAS